MSLINEALKRTRDGSYRHGSVPAAVPAAYRIATPPRESSATRRQLALAGALAVAVAMGLAAYQFRARPVAAPAPVADVQSDEAQLVQQLLSPLAPPPVRAPVAPPEPVAPVSPPAVAAPPPRALPALSLQGILRGGKFTEAMINGYTYRVGDEVSGAKVLAIEDSAVRLELDGREFTLRMR